MTSNETEIRGPHGLVLNGVSEPKRIPGGMIYQKIADVMKEIQPIAKNQQNVQQKFKFRGVDDVYNSLQPLLAKHNLFSVTKVLSSHVDSRESKSGTGTVLRFSTLTIEFRLYTTDGSFVSGIVEGVGMDTGDKGSNKAMAVAHKYFLTQLFMIPTADMEDPDRESLEFDKEPNNSNPYPKTSAVYTPPAQGVSQNKTKSKNYDNMPAIPITKPQVRLLTDILKKKNLSADAFAKEHGYQSAANITMDKFNDLLLEAKNVNLKQTASSSDSSEQFNDVPM